MKGRTNNPNGRPKGKPNKVTASIKAKCEKILSMTMKEILKDIDKMDMKEKIQLVSALTKFSLPTAIHIDQDSNSNLTIIWKEEKYNEENNETND